MYSASAPAGMSDGVMTPRKASVIWSSGGRRWLKGVSRNTVRRQYVEICTKVTNSEKREGCDEFDTVPTIPRNDVKSLRAGRKSGGPFVLPYGILRIVFLSFPIRRCCSK